MGVVSETGGGGGVVVRGDVGSWLEGVRLRGPVVSDMVSYLGLGIIGA